MLLSPQLLILGARPSFSFFLVTSHRPPSLSTTAGRATPKPLEAPAPAAADSSPSYTMVAALAPLAKDTLEACGSGPFFGGGLFINEPTSRRSMEEACATHTIEVSTTERYAFAIVLYLLISHTALDLALPHRVESTGHETE